MARTKNTPLGSSTTPTAGLDGDFPPDGTAFKRKQKAGIAAGASLGTRLFVSVLGSSLVGLSALAFLFYQQLSQRAHRDIERQLESQANRVAAQLGQAEQHARALGAAAIALKKQGIKSVAAYQQLAFNAYLTLPDLAFGIGLGQTPRALVPNPRWFFPYYYRDQAVEGQVGKRLGTPYEDVFYAELFGDNNYPESPYYKLPVEKKQSLWLEPYGSYGALISSYASPIIDSSGKLLGVTNVNVNLSQLASQLAASTAEGRGDRANLALLSAAGNIVAYPAAQPDPPAEGKPGNSFETVPVLAKVWPTVQQRLADNPAGFLQLEGTYWAYRRLPGSNWVMLASVPQSAVLVPILAISLGAATVVAILLFVTVAAFMAGLNRRLRPILATCDEFIEATGGDITLGGRDEIEQLSMSFETMMRQIAVKEELLREEVTRTIQAQERLLQTQEAEKESLALEAEIGSLLDVVSSMEEGDLTIQAEVSDRATGLVADTLNRLREQLTQIIAGVLAAAQQVAMGARELEQLARTVAYNASEQAKSVAQGTALTEQVAALAQASAEQVNQANQALQNVEAAVSQGQVAIEQMAAGIAVLQEGTAQIVQRMKTLGEFVGLAEQFVQDQGQIASLTQVLAINATLVAARAAEQRDPKQFIGVAREFEAIAGQVNALATQTNEGLSVLQQRTSQIQAVVKAIDTEVQGLGGLVAGFTSGVEKSQSAFYDVQSLTQQVVSVGQAITQSSEEIAEAATSTANYISDIASLAQQTTELTSSTSERAERMGTLARNLLDNIRFFRLPEALTTEDEERSDREMQTVEIAAERASTK